MLAIAGPVVFLGSPPEPPQSKKLSLNDLNNQIAEQIRFYGKNRQLEHRQDKEKTMERKWLPV